MHINASTYVTIIVNVKECSLDVGWAGQRVPEGGWREEKEGEQYNSISIKNIFKIVTRGSTGA